MRKFLLLPLLFSAISMAAEPAKEVLVDCQGLKVPNLRSPQGESLNFEERKDMSLTIYTDLTVKLSSEGRSDYGYQAKVEAPEGNAAEGRQLAAEMLKLFGISSVSADDISLHKNYRIIKNGSSGSDLSETAGLIVVQTKKGDTYKFAALGLILSLCLK